MRLDTAALALTVSLGVIGCKSGDSATDTSRPTLVAATEAEAKAIVHTDAKPHVHQAACGCTMEKQCGNFVKIGSKYVPIAGDVGIGEMAYCGKEGVTVEVEGSMKDGIFVATSYRVVGPSQ